MTARQATPPARESAVARRLRIRSARLVTSLFAGEYQSVFRGRGIEFESVREYQPGDDVRAIDWNVTARAGRPFVKQFVEEREMTVMLLLDRSASLAGDGPQGARAKLAAEVAALLILAASRGNDRVGLLAFSAGIEQFIPAAKGPRHAQRLIAELSRSLSDFGISGCKEAAPVQFSPISWAIVPPFPGEMVKNRPRRGPFSLSEPKVRQAPSAPDAQGSDLAGALRYLEKVQRRGAIVFLLSDFIVPDFRLPLAAAARHHDLVAIRIDDPLDHELPNAGLIQVTDPETGARRLIDSGNAKVRAAWARHTRQRLDALARTLEGAGVEQLAISAAEAPVHALARFFQNRQRRMRR